MLSNFVKSPINRNTKWLTISSFCNDFWEIQFGMFYYWNTFTELFKNAIIYMLKFRLYFAHRNENQSQSKRFKWLQTWQHMVQWFRRLIVKKSAQSKQRTLGLGGALWHCMSLSKCLTLPSLQRFNWYNFPFCLFWGVFPNWYFF